MEKKEIFKYIDHTLLKPEATWQQIKKLCEEGVKYNTASVCIPPCYVKRVHENFPKLNICTVIGFPLGYEVLAAKAEETKKALEEGASEIDMVINITDVKNKEFEKVKNEIKELKKICGNNILKVIIETCYLIEEEKIEMCRAVTDGGADYIKTSTGFGIEGAKIEDIKLFKKHIGENVKIKAAGGIKDLKEIEMFIKEGCSRIGTSRAVGLLKEE